MMMSALPVATVLIAAMGDAGVINVRLYYAYNRPSKMKRRAYSLNSCARLFGMDAGDSI
jgi:hypothetical protein